MFSDLAEQREGAGVEVETGKGPGCREVAPPRLEVISTSLVTRLTFSFLICTAQGGKSEGGGSRG